MKLKIFILTIFQLFLIKDEECSLISSDIFQSIPNKKLDSFSGGSFNLSFYARSLISCIYICIINENCVLISYSSTQCKLYNVIQYQYMIESPTTSLYKRMSNVFDGLNSGLQNYWPILNSNVNDKVGTANMYNGVNASFTNDRFNNSNSAIFLENGYYRIPPGIYFCGDFTFSIWAYFRQQHSIFWNRFFDFGNGASADNIAFSYSRITDYKPSFFIFNSGITINTTISPVSIRFNTWDHYAFSFSGNVGRLYINGSLVAYSTQSKPNCVNRSYNYIGKSNFPNNLNANAKYDEIRLYNRALDAAEIQNLMKL